MSGIALIGMACVFPGAEDCDQYWSNICAGVDAISEVPAHRWDASFYDPHSTAVDKFYCRRGGFVDAQAWFDPLAFGIMPRVAEAIEPEQLLTLRMGFQALHDAGYATRAFPRERTGVIIGRGNYVNAGVLRLEQHVRWLPQLRQTLDDLFPDQPASWHAAIADRVRAALPYYGPDAASGLIPNLVASRLANRLDCQGPAYTVDAACASALIAVEQAMGLLRQRQTDLMLVGGVHLSHDLTFWATFCQLGALSRQGTIRPLSAAADGILAGEGVGMVVLKRVEDALRDGDRIYAVLEGAGSASDGRASSLVAPSVAGQLLAVRRAWSGLSIQPDQLSLLEAHGTGTPTGDAVELETMAQFFGAGAPTAAPAVIGSVKSMIGHAMPASGMASLIKTALAIHHGVLPPTLHCDTPHPRMAETRFRPLAQAQAWTQPRTERVAGINAFGFGGINAHLVLRGSPAEANPTSATPEAWPSDVLPALRLAADTPEALLAQLDACLAGATPPMTATGACRLVVLAPDAARLARARQLVVAGKAWPGRQNIWFTPRGLLQDGGQLAFVFPGVDSTFAPRREGLAALTGRAVPAACQPADPATDLMSVVLGLLPFNHYLAETLQALGVAPDHLAGHSIGEWSAMQVGGMLDPALSEATHEALRAGLHGDAARFPNVHFLAAACSAETLSRHLVDVPGAALSHDNCPNQSIACGAPAVIDTLHQQLQAEGIIAHRLPIVSGFHSPAFADYLGWYQDYFQRAGLQPAQRPVWSATTTQPFPTEMGAILSVVLEHLVAPVRFRALTQTLYDQGVRVFVQVGTGSLTGFINDTLTGQPHRAVAANVAARSGAAQLQQVAATVWVEGGALIPALLSATPGAAEIKPAAPSRPQPLALGVPLLRVSPPMPSDMGLIPRAPEVMGDDPIAQAVAETLREIQAAGEAVLTAWQQHRPLSVPLPVGLPAFSHQESVVLDLAQTVPWVQDHELYPQQPGWPIVEDRHPVVPMTMEAMLLHDALTQVLAARGLPGRVVAIEALEAYQWLTIATPQNVTLTLSCTGGDRVQAALEGFCRATLVVASDWQPAPTAFSPLLQPQPTAVPAEELYAEGWMFHGPAYQGVAAFLGINRDGIEGTLTVPSGQGALLDNMGQLAGYWVMEQPENCLAMPIGVDSIAFHGPQPQPGERFTGQVRVRELDALNCVTDHRLLDATGQVRISITGWRTRRYQMDQALWVASRKLSAHIVSQAVPPAVTVFWDRYDTAILRDYLSRRYLTAVERTVYEQLPPRRRRQWLAGRIAAKDAVMTWIRARSQTPVYPQMLIIENTPAGVPTVRAQGAETLPLPAYLSISHKDQLAAAMVGDTPVGIDVERLEPRTPDFWAQVHSPAEQALLQVPDEDVSVAMLRGWVAKEVVGKMAGTGLAGNPLRWTLSARDDAMLVVADQAVVTQVIPPYVLGWTLNP